MAPGLNVELVCFPSEIRGALELLHQGPMGGPNTGPQGGVGVEGLGHPFAGCLRAWSTYTHGLAIWEEGWGQN